MGRRPTRKAGILKIRHPDPLVQRALDSITERIEVLDGLRGDELDQAVTFRDLVDAGYTVGSGYGSGGSGPGIVAPPPSSDDGPGIGPTTAPTNLATMDIFLGILLTWDNPPFNLQHIEVWRATEDNLSLAVMIGTSVSPQYVDYVGFSSTYYYWVRALATDGTYSAYNDTAGTLGTTGVDPGSFQDYINISASNLDALLAARIDLIDTPITGLVARTGVLEGTVVSLDERTDLLEVTSNQLVSDVDGHTTSIQANANAISTNGTRITTLSGNLEDALDSIALNAQGIAANAYDIVQLQASVGALDSENGQIWEFTTDTESFTTFAATAVWSNGVLVFTPTSSDPQLRSPTISVTGGIYTQVVARIRQTTAGGTWEGRVYYHTASHGRSALYYKAISNPGLSINEWQVLTWDMSDLTAGGTDWVDNTITGIDLDLVSDAAGVFEVDWIQIARFSVSAVADALSALDVRVTANTNTASAHGTRLDLLEATVDNPTTGVSATSQALSALTIDVGLNEQGVTANAQAINALESTVNDPVSGVAANSSAIGTLETDVSNLDGTLTAQAQSITQLVASIDGGLASIVNPLTTAGENYGTSLTPAEVTTFLIGGRAGVSAKVATNGNSLDYVYQSDGTRIFLQPTDIYEVRCRVYHDRPTLAGSFYLGLYSYETAGSSTLQTVEYINNGLVTGSTTNPYWFSARNTAGDNEWMDIVAYILGPEADPAECPAFKLNGSADNPGGYTFSADGLRASGPYVALRFLNYNGAPTYGDGTTTTLYVTDFQVSRVNTSGELYAALQVEASARATQIGELHAVYAVKAELSAGGVPYVTGFGLMADVIDGTATSAFGVRADQFFITSPTNPDDRNPPFLAGFIDGTFSVGINGDLLVDGTIRGTSIVAGDIGADQIGVNQLSAISADMGTLTSGLIRTAASPAWRVEIQDTASTAWPIWYGSNAKSEANGRFYVDAFGNVVVKGLLQAGMIRQSFFTPSVSTYNPFRIACDYPNNYSGGVYTGKAAHLMPMRNTTQSDQRILQAADPLGDQGTGLVPLTNFTSNTLTLYGPSYTGTVEYGRLGTNTELIEVVVQASFQSTGGYYIGDATIATPIITSSNADIYVEYIYNGDTQWNKLAKLRWQTAGGSTFYFPIVISSRSTSFQTLQFRLRVVPINSSRSPAEYWKFLLLSSSISVKLANFGYGGNSLVSLTASELLNGITPAQLEAKTGTTSILRLPGYNGTLIN